MKLKKIYIFAERLLFIFASFLILFSCKTLSQTVADLPKENLTEIEALAEFPEEFPADTSESGIEIEEAALAEEDEINIEEYIVEVIEPEHIIDEESGSIEERIEGLEQQLAALQEQLAQLTEQSAPLPPAAQAPPAVQTPPLEQSPSSPAPAVQPGAQVAAQEPAPPPDPLPGDLPARTPHPLPPVRETLPPPTPSQTIVVPREQRPDTEIVFSRVVRATVGQIIEIPFRGTGWVYLGELASRRGIAYDSRKNDPEGLSFVFRAEEAGTYALKFSRHDFIRDYILNDHVQVIIGEAPTASAGWFNPPSNRDRVIAQPRWPSASEEAEILRGGTGSGAGSGTNSGDRTAAGSTARQEAIPLADTAPSSVESAVYAPGEPSNISEVIQGSGPPNLPVYEPPGLPVPPPVAVPGSGQPDTAQTPEQVPQVSQVPIDQLIQRAKETFEAGNVTGALALLDQFREQRPSGTDELYWYYGQFYEANTPARNILLSLDYYKRLTSEFPQSSRFNDAKRRIAYLERFYINIQ